MREEEEVLKPVIYITRTTLQLLEEAVCEAHNQGYVVHVPPVEVMVSGRRRICQCMTRKNQRPPFLTPLFEAEYSNTPGGTP
jgi:hypothetical protein